MTSNVSTAGLNVYVPVPGIQNSSETIRNNFKIIKDALDDASSEITVLQTLIDSEGPTGPRGEKGDLGPTGPQGVQGFQGSEGIQGPIGFTGATGAQGRSITGDTGPQGPTGTASTVPGPRGAQGETGPTGPFGTMNVPIASTIQLGGVIIGSNITVKTNGLITINRANVEDALGYTPVNAQSSTWYGMISGLTPLVVTQTSPVSQITISPGALTVVNINTTDGNEPAVAAFNNFSYLNINASGSLYGLDAGTPVNNTSYYVYALYKPSTNQSAFIISAATTIAGVTVPNGYTKFRKMPFGFVFKNGGLLPMTITSWPQPSVFYTLFNDTSTYRILTDGTSRSWKPIDISPLVPANAGLIYVRCYTNNASGGISRLSISNVENNTTNPGTLVGGYPNDPHGGANSLWFPVNGNLIYYKVGTSNNLDVSVQGYAITEIT